jgi:hypothetical protein
MTRLEKGILSAIVVLILFMGVLSYILVDTINEAGGVKQVLIDAGKDVKDITREIEKH